MYLVTKTDRIERAVVDMKESHRVGVTTASENEKDEGRSLKDLKLDDSQVIDPRAYKDQIVDDLK